MYIQIIIGVTKARSMKLGHVYHPLEKQEVYTKFWLKISWEEACWRCRVKQEKNN
jgi:hypothetical protein